MSDSEIFEQEKPIDHIDEVNNNNNDNVNTLTESINTEIQSEPKALPESVVENHSEGINNASIKPKKKKRVLTPEQKERLLNNLRKGREKSLATRRKNKLLKKAQKKEENEAKDALLAKTFLNNENDSETKKLKAEMEELRKQLNKQKLQEMPEPVVMEVKEIKRPPTPNHSEGINNASIKPKVTHTEENPFLNQTYKPSKPINIPKKKRFVHGVTSYWDQFK